MDIRNHGNGADIMNGPEGTGRGFIRDGHADDFATRVSELSDLIQSRLHVPRVGIGHALNGDGSAAADGNAAQHEATGSACGESA